MGNRLVLKTSRIYKLQVFSEFNKRGMNNLNLIKNGKRV